MDNYVDIKYTIWQRAHFKDNTNMQKIVKLIKEDYNYIFDEELGFKENEILYDNEEFIPPEENKASTIEVYENNKLIYENFKNIE